MNINKTQFQKDYISRCRAGPELYEAESKLNSSTLTCIYVAHLANLETKDFRMSGA